MVRIKIESERSGVLFKNHDILPIMVLFALTDLDFLNVVLRCNLS